MLLLKERKSRQCIVVSNQAHLEEVQNKNKSFTKSAAVYRVNVGYTSPQCTVLLLRLTNTLLSLDWDNPSSTVTTVCLYTPLVSWRRNTYAVYLYSYIRPRMYSVSVNTAVFVLMLHLYWMSCANQYSDFNWYCGKEGYNSS